MPPHLLLHGRASRLATLRHDDLHKSLRAGDRWQGGGRRYAPVRRTRANLASCLAEQSSTHHVSRATSWRQAHVRARGGPATGGKISRYARDSPHRRAEWSAESARPPGKKVDVDAGVPERLADAAQGSQPNWRARGCVQVHITGPRRRRRLSRSVTQARTYTSQHGSTYIAEMCNSPTAGASPLKTGELPPCGIGPGQPGQPSGPAAGRSLEP